MPKAKTSQSDAQLLENIKKEVDELLDNSKPTKKEVKKTSKTIERLQEDLDRIESENLSKKEEKKRIIKETNDYEIKKKIVIKKKRISDSFFKWLFNNYEI